jgi:hypothetical protein
MGASMLYKVNQAEKNLFAHTQAHAGWHGKQKDLTMLDKQIDLEEYIAYLDTTINPTPTMPYQIVTWNYSSGRTIIDTFPNYAAAKHAAETRFPISYYEQDADVEYVAADFITDHGAIYSIEPANNVSQGGPNQ